MTETMNQSLFSWLSPEVETTIRGELNTDVSDKIVGKFFTLVRESGSAGEVEGVNFIAPFLKQWGVTYNIYTPNLYISRPRKAEVNVVKPSVKAFKAKNPAMTALTGEAGVAAKLIYVRSGYARGAGDLLVNNMALPAEGVRGKIVLTEGLPLPGKIGTLTEQGAVAVIFISPGLNIHEGIATSIWGSPDLDSDGQQPALPIVSVNRTDGAELKELCSQGEVEVNVITRTETGWYECPVLVADIEGTEDPDKFVLLHGHLDSWHEGVGDNATGDAALLEMTRVFHKHRHLLKRSLRVAWWPGHSYGRYAGSTWFADNFGFDIESNCIAQVNCDSPGCRWATAYNEVDWMSEVDEFCQAVIRDAVRQSSKGTRPARAGDYSFNNIGVTSFFMLSSSMPDEVREEKGYYAVGGCGGNIEWHTEEDLIQLYDPEIQLKDLKVYTTGVLRVLNAPIHPFNFANTVEEILSTLANYQEIAADRFDFQLATTEGEKLLATLQEFHSKLESLRTAAVSDEEVREANHRLEKLSRILIRINYSRKGIFRHDPAVDVPPLPDIAAVKGIDSLEAGSHKYNVLLNHLVRGTNRIAWALKEAREVLSHEG